MGQPEISDLDRGAINVTEKKSLYAHFQELDPFIHLGVICRIYEAEFNQKKAICLLKFLFKKCFPKK